ncbi:MAG: YgjV family protein, partial [Pseudomonadota bacterium]
MGDLSTYQIIAQAIGILASIVVISSTTLKNDNYFKIALIIGNIIFMTHFFMLGAYAGAFTNVLNACRAGFSMKFHKSTNAMILFMSSYALLGIILFEN